MMFSNDDIVPVVMFHSVGLEKSDWVFSHISEPLKTFEEKIVGLVSSGYQFIFWKDLYDHMSGLRRVPRKSIMLTFDDGYLDNWVFVFPILNKYAAKATIFVSPEFVDPQDNLRPNMEDVWSGKVREDEIQTLGFLNWEEMRVMEQSGLVDIQSHALSHTWHFTGPRLLDFYKPGDKDYPWLAWNMKPELKPFSVQNDQNRIVPWGTPIYEYEKALISRRYLPPQEVAEAITALVNQKGGGVFFQQKGWEKELRDYHDELMKKYEHKGRFESTDGFRKRVFEELRGSKELIEKHLNKNVDFISWPGGAYNDELLSLAKHAGYKAWTLSSKDRISFRNRPGSDPTHIKRISSFAKYRNSNGKTYGYAGTYYFKCGVERHQGSFFYKWLGRFLLFFAFIKSMATGQK